LAASDDITFFRRIIFFRSCFGEGAAFGTVGLSPGATAALDGFSTLASYAGRNGTSAEMVAI
jgi:Trk-type K+ transport system membrane component